MRTASKKLKKNRIIQTRNQGFLSQTAYTTIRQLDKIFPFSTQLSKRSLWGHLPRSISPTPDQRKLLALSFDLDYREDTNALTPLLNLVDEVGVKMTLFCIGKLVEADPVPYQKAVSVGHEIGNHTWSHPDNPVLNPNREFWDLDAEEMREEIEKAQRVFEEYLGVRARGFRSPHFKDAQRLVKVLEAIPKITYMSSALATQTPLAQPYFPFQDAVVGEASLLYSSTNVRDNSSVLMIPLTACPKHRWSPFCSYHAIRRPANPKKGCGMHSLEKFEQLWKKTLTLAEKDQFASFYFDPKDIMQDAQTSTTFTAMLEWAIENGWEITTLSEIEATWRPFLEPQNELEVQKMTR